MRSASRVPWCLLIIAVLLVPAFILPAFADAQPGAGCTTLAAVRIADRVDDNVRVTLTGQVHPLARAEYDQGIVDDALPLEHIMMMLQRSTDQEAALTTRIDQMHNRRSPLYHQWLSAPQVGTCYGVADRDIATLSSWLQSHGFKVDSVPAGKMLILFSGTAGQVRRVFHTEIHNLNVHGERHIANMTAPQIPAALAPVIAGFHSLHNFFPKPLLHVAGPVRRDAQTNAWHPLDSNGHGSSNDSPGSHSLLSFAGGGYDWLAVGPQDLYTIYNERPLLTASTPINGAGQTLAVIEPTDINQADVTTFRSQFGLPTYPASPNSTQGGVNWLQGANGACTDPGKINDAELEADLDVEWIGTTAPNAIIDFVSCADTSTTSGVDLAGTYVVNGLDSTVSAISVSYGLCEADLVTNSTGFQTNSYYQTLWEQAVAQGQTVVVAAGDSGDDVCDRGNNPDVGSTGLSVSGITSTPYDVSAGGTDFSDVYQGNYANYWNTNDTSPYLSALSYIPEKSWNNSCGSAIIASYLGGTPEEVCNDSTYAVLANLNGGSGGISTIYSLPTWQSAYGVGLSSNLTSTSHRNVPDIAMFASGGVASDASGFKPVWSHFLVLCNSDSGFPCDYANGTDAFAMNGGGTSFVAPIFTGIIGLINQAHPSGNPSQPTRQGQANYTLYALGTAEYGTTSTENTSTSEPSVYTCESNYLAISAYSSIFPDCIFHDLNRTPVPGTTTCVGATSTNCVVDNNAQPCTAGTTDCLTSTGDTIGILATGASVSDYAFPQSAGYNAVGGLGSVNITNLVNNWTTVTPLFASTTTVTANPASISASGTTTLTATVTATERGGIAPPLGTVTFYVGNSCSGTALGTMPLIPASGCTTSCHSAATLAGVTGTQLGGSGTQHATGCFSGDGANDATSNGVATITVTGGGKTSTTTVLTSSQNPSMSGASVTFTANVSPSGSPIPTGSVAFTSNGSVITGCSSVALASAAASCKTSALAVGTDAIVATYSGDANYSGSSGAFAQLVNPPASAVQFFPVTPCRVVDTRKPAGPFGGPELPAGTSRSFAIPSGPCLGIPSTAAAYSLNVTVVPPGPLGYLTIWPTGEGQPVVSTLNSLDGRVKANAAIVPAGTPGGEVSVYVNNTSNVLLDIDGYFAASSGASLEFYPLAPCRIVDTRKADGLLGGPVLAAATERDFPILSGPCSIPGTAKAYSLNFTVVPPATGDVLDYLTVWPQGDTRPVVSTLNNFTGTVVANAAIVPAGTSGGVAVYPSDATNLLIDVNGYFAAPGTGGLQLYALTPCRVLDTRSSSGAFNGQLTVNVTGSTCAPPGTAQAFVFNATAVPSGDLGYLTLWPDGESQPVVSTLNAEDGAITSNMAVVSNKNGKVDAYASGTTQLVMDISAYFAP